MGGIIHRYRGKEDGHQIEPAIWGKSLYLIAVCGFSVKEPSGAPAAPST